MISSVTAKTARHIEAFHAEENKERRWERNRCQEGVPNLLWNDHKTATAIQEYQAKTIDKGLLPATRLPAKSRKPNELGDAVQESV